MGSLVSGGNRENSFSDGFLLIPFKPILAAQTCQLVTMCKRAASLVNGIGTRHRPVLAIDGQNPAGCRLRRVAQLSNLPWRQTFP